MTKKKETKKEEEKRSIDIVKMQRQVSISKPQLTVTLVSECVSEDMEYLTNKASELLKKL